jgi:hypothetical protein
MEAVGQLTEGAAHDSNILLRIILGGCPTIGIVARKWGSEAKLA